MPTFEEFEPEGENSFQAVEDAVMDYFNNTAFPVNKNADSKVLSHGCAGSCNYSRTGNYAAV